LIVDNWEEYVLHNMCDFVRHIFVKSVQCLKKVFIFAAVL